MLAFNYNRKISRPSFWNLNPYRMPLSEYSFLEGNPRLRPAYQNSYSGQLDHPAQIFADRRIRIGQRKFRNRSQRPIRTTDIILYRYENVPIGRNFNLNVNVPTNITPWWMLNLNLTAMNCFSSLARPPEYGTGIPEQRADDPQRVDARPESELPDSPVMGQHAYERTVQRRRRPPAVAAEKRLTASLTVHNLINYNKENIRIVEPTFERTVEQRQNWRQIAVSLRYNFKTGKEVKVRNVESGSHRRKVPFLTNPNAQGSDRPGFGSRMKIYYLCNYKIKTGKNNELTGQYYLAGVWGIGDRRRILHRRVGAVPDDHRHPVPGCRRSKWDC